MTPTESKVVRTARIFIPFLFSVMLSALVFAQDTDNLQPASPKDPGSDLIDSIGFALRTEQEQLSLLKVQIKEIRLVEKAVAAEIKAYRIQNSAYGNLLLFPSADLQNLEAALVENRSATDAIGERIEDWTKRLATVHALQSKAKEQVELSELQHAEIKSGQWSKEKKDVIDLELKKLKKILAEKLKVLDQLQSILSTGIENLREVGDAVGTITGELEEEINARTTRKLFERKIISLRTVQDPKLLKELNSLGEGMGRLTDIRFWTGGGLRIKGSGAMPFLTLVFLTLIVGLLVRRLIRFCLRCEGRPSASQFRWRTICLSVLRRSAYLLGAAGVLFGYDIVQFPNQKLPVIRLLLHMVLVWLFSGWFLAFIRIRSAENDAPVWNAMAGNLKSTIHFLRYFSLVYLFVLWAAGHGGIMLTALRLILEVGLVALNYRLWKSVRNASRTGPEKMPTLASPLSFIMGASYVVIFLGLVVEFAGYPSLAEYWFVSWAKSVTVLFWIVLSFLTIREWQRHHRKTVQAGETDVTLAAGHPLTLFFIQCAWFLWLLFFIDGLVLAWSTNWEVFNTVYAFMNRPWAIGKIQLSNVGLIYAVIILFFTHSLSRLGRYILTEKILRDSDMEPGLQVSVTSIFVYLMWAFGILVALGILGVDTTSLAVIFGALSIGIGFGLQNIFNNFISGIILLFERPIQVGDAVEIGGIWGEVKKINVRATVVQTFDNASLIIPNSEFISSQVINWSFKDKRMRRRVNVGVAYGSDIELVRETLLEIAENIPQVLKYPRPDVLFLDHGDSALIFSLRYWTHIDHFFSSSTDIRFALDKRFRALGIEIAFPQRDIHIRSGILSGEVNKPADDMEPNA